MVGKSADNDGIATDGGMLNLIGAGGTAAAASARTYV